MSCLLFFNMKNANDYKEILANLFEKIESFRTETPSAGTKFRLMGLSADVTEVVGTLQKELLSVLSREALVDVDYDINYAELSERLLAMEIQEAADAEDIVREQTHLCNEAIGMLSELLENIDKQLARHHKDEEYERLYNDERHRYLASSTARRARQTFEQWKDYECDGCPQQEQIDDYRLEKVVQMFEKGVFNERVEHMQRAKRYPGELELEQLGDERKIQKTIYHHYAALRKLVDFRDGCLVINPVRVGRHFYACRQEENARQKRTLFLKYMHKVELAQSEYSSPQTPQENDGEDCMLPAELATGVAMKYWQKLQQHEFVDENYQLCPNTTRKQAMFIADMFSETLNLSSKWKVFQDLWHINNLAQEKWEMQETGKTPTRHKEMRKIFSNS